MKYIVDVDGTLMDGKKANLDAVEFIQELKKRKLDFIVMTNSIAPPDWIQKRLASVGMDVELDRIFNPVYAINIFLKENKINNAFIVGTDDDRQRVWVPHEEEKPELVILLDFEDEDYGYKVLQKIIHWMNEGVPVISASGSLFYLRGGKQYLDTGSFVQLLENVTSKKIEILGKPSKAYFTAGIHKLGCPPEEVKVIGDDWRTDIKGAKGMGCHAVLVKAGRYREGDELRIDAVDCTSRLMDVLTTA